MQQIAATVTSRGQVTIPARARKALGLRAGDRVLFVIDDGCVTLRRAPYTIETAFGSVRPLRIPEDWDERVREAKAERAARIAGSEDSG
ncbi:MAG TPA: AbrB/MazE/SpoVT family DNA-binding domain-containing protein [Dehalococcoidia bacterium]|nr:AbrB/MazE/SpoVT family DNA-binding domain-containing protein [Dehalococcoidia bacterium]